MRIRNFVTQQVIFLRLIDTVLIIYARTETAWIEAAHRHIGGTVYHPLRQVFTRTRSPGDANL